MSARGWSRAEPPRPPRGGRIPCPPRGGCGGGQPAPPDARRIRRPAGHAREPRGLHPGRPRPRRGAGPRAAARPARPRQDHAGADRRPRAGRRLPRHIGAGDPAGRRPRRNPDKPPTQGCPVHRRDPSPAARDRGSALPGDGRLPARPDHRRGAGGALGAHRPARRSRWSAPPRGPACSPRRCATASASRCAWSSTRPRNWN